MQRDVQHRCQHANPVVRIAHPRRSHRRGDPRPGEPQDLEAIAERVGRALEDRLRQVLSRNLVIESNELAAKDRRCYVASARPTDRGRNMTRPGRSGFPSSSPSSSVSGRPATFDHQDRHEAAERMTPIWCQVSGSAWQNACTTDPGSGAKRSVVTQSTPDVPSDRNALPGPIAPTPIAPAALSPAPPATIGRCANPQRAAISGRNRPRFGGALNEGRHLAHGKPRRGQRCIAPATLADIKPERSGRIRHLVDCFAGEAEADERLRQENQRDLAKHVRLVPTDPQEFGRRETRHRQVAGHVLLAGECVRELGAFRDGAPVVPEDAAPHLPGASSSVAPCIWPESPMPRNAANSPACAARSCRRRTGRQSTSLRDPAPNIPDGAGGPATDGRPSRARRRRRQAVL